MNTTEVQYIKNDDRQIIIDTNEFITDISKKWVTKAPALVYKDGKFLTQRDAFGNVSYDESHPGSMVQIPKTSRLITAGEGKNGKLATGLDIMISNPYSKDEDLYGKWKEVLYGKPKALLQHLLEYEHGVEYNYYTNSINKEEPFRKGQEKYFYQTSASRVKLTNGFNVLDMRNPNHRVNYYMLLKHPVIANSYSELEYGANMMARWYIVDSDEKAKVQVQRKEKSRNLSFMLVSLEKEDEGRALTEMVKALYLEQSRDRGMKPDKALTILEEYGSMSEGYNILEEMFNMRKNPDTQSMFDAYVLLTDLIIYNIVQFKDGSIVWKRRNEDGTSATFSRSDRESMVNSFLLNPAHKDQVADMLMELSNYRS